LGAKFDRCRKFTEKVLWMTDLAYAYRYAALGLEIFGRKY